MPLVPLITNSGPSASLYAPAAGGGGGGGGPNPSVSSLTLGVGGQIEFMNDNTWDTQGIAWATDATNTSSIIIQPTYATNEAGAAGKVVIGVALGSAAATNYWDVAARGIYLEGTGFPPAAGAYLCSDPNNVGSAYVSSLNVSSLNGAAPGGGGSGPNLSVSSINVSSGGYIEMFTGPSNDTGRIIGYSDTNNASSMSLFVGFVPNYASKVNGTDGLWLVENDSTGVNQAFGDFGAGRLVVLGNNAGPSKKVPVLDSDGAGSLEINGVGALNISTNIVEVPYALTTISTLVVSSINGAAPGGGAISNFSTASISSLSVSSINGGPIAGNPYPQNSTLKTSDGTGLSINASSLTTLAAYSTISSHFYTVSVDIGPRQLTQAFGPNDGFQTQLTTDDGLVNILNDGLWSQISTLNNLAVTPALGGSATFKAGGSFFTIDIYNTYANTLSTNLNAIFAVDHGPGN